MPVVLSGAGFGALPANARKLRVEQYAVAASENDIGSGYEDTRAIGLVCDAMW